MLNAVKHLYRTVERMGDSTTGILRGAQYDYLLDNYLLALVASFKYATLLLCLLLATASHAQSYAIKTLDGNNTLIRIQDSTFASSTSSPLTISCPTDKLVVAGYWAAGEIKIVGEKFLQIRYHKRTGSDISIGNTLLLCINHGKLRQAVHIESYSSNTRYVSRKDYDHSVKKIAETRLVVDAKGIMCATVYDSLIHKMATGINKVSSKKYIINFNQKQQVFSNYQKKINAYLIEFSYKTDLVERRHFTGNVPAFQLGEVEYIFIGRNWYTKNSSAKEYSLVN